MKCISYYFFNVISNKTRWNIISSLYSGEKCVSDICKEITEEQSKVSHNLKILAGCNVVFSKRVGKKIIYRVNKKTLDPLFLIVEKHMKNNCKNGCKQNKI
jgi:DNA-binding transcriptional ArsR family regulator